MGFVGVLDFIVNGLIKYLENQTSRKYGRCSRLPTSIHPPTLFLAGQSITLQMWACHSPAFLASPAAGARAYDPSMEPEQKSTEGLLDKPFLLNKASFFT